ncbi:hypothetical protein CLV24_101245 [Pontibacter ummariensis]|uniref:Uncharacterized protein n=1 Tax=Pontibacter ummariensis TaxID=1610492 RepID=A0A239BBX4_9BACT|nr:hypothetical protein [Pontibacter ummariensis]PRY16400.1 hypothetical protein CLV24_101245 [Pontibacter ummariensis]SNS04503.1 hypothetical protein SAMN06296052_101245 [Pontibacter ummariensis]
MKAPIKVYLREMRREFGYIPTWEPTRQIILGSVGVFKKNIFTRLSELKDFGIGFEMESDQQPGILEYSSPNGFAITTKVADASPIPGSSIPQDKAGLIIDFSRDNTIIFRANGASTPTIRDLSHVQSEVIRLYKEGKWDKNWSVVTEAVYADRCTLLISTHRNAKAELVASGNFDLSDIDLANEIFHSNQHSFRGLVVNLVARQSISPLFKLMKLKSSRRISPTLRSMDVDPMDQVTPATADQFNLYLGEVTFEELVKEEEELLAPQDVLQRALPLQVGQGRESLLGRRVENLLPYDLR